MNEVAALEKQMLVHEQVEIPVVHRFMPGMYVREITVPAGVLLVGHSHKTDHTTMLLRGSATLTDELGNVSEVVGPMMMASKPGRKAAYSHEESVWLNIHATTETNLDVLEAELIEKSPQWLEHQAALIGVN